MNEETLQAVWQSHVPSQPPLAPLQLLEETMNEHRSLRRSMIQRDVTEVASAIMVLVIFGGFAVLSSEWTLWLIAVGGLFVGGFMIADRWIQSRRRVAVQDNLQSCVQAAMVEIQHQIWLLENIFWWYLLPLIPGIAFFLGSLAWRTPLANVGEQLVIAAVGLICLLAFAYAYRINQRAIHQTLEPQRLKLAAMLSSLNPEQVDLHSTSKQVGETTE